MTITSRHAAAAPASSSGPGRRGLSLSLGLLLQQGQQGRAAAPGRRLAVPEPVTPRAYRCRCGRPVFFRNSLCLACETPLGYDPMLQQLLPLEPVGGEAASATRWRRAEAPAGAPEYRRCANLAGAAGCNWLVAPDDRHAGEPALCRCCRLTRTRPDLTLENGATWWRRIEQAKRRLVSTLLGLKLPVRNKAEDPARGLVFDLLRAPPGGPQVVTGHADGVITLDVTEADDGWRQQRSKALGEPYRTLLGHLRHETGHYYWQRLVQGSEWLEPCRRTFGDERQDYTQALQRHYQQGAPADWGERFVSAYASSHPWEDWAETWAHYLHLVDTLDTARSFGLDGDSVLLEVEPFDAGVLEANVDDAMAQDFLRLVRNWMELIGVLNELSRSMGVPDFYPFVLSAAAVRKLYLVHQVVQAGAP